MKSDMQLPAHETMKQLQSNAFVYLHPNLKKEKHAKTYGKTQRRPGRAVVATNVPLPYNLSRGSGESTS